MKHITSKLLSLLLTLAMLLSMVPAAYAVDAESGTSGEAGDDKVYAVVVKFFMGENSLDLEYDNIADAIKEIPSYLDLCEGETVTAITVTLNDEVTATETLKITNDVTFDLNGHTLTVETTGDGIEVENAALTLTNTGSAGKYVFNCAASGSDGIYVHNTDENTTSTLNINSGVEIQVQPTVNSAVHIFGESGNAVVNMYGGRIAVSGFSTSQFSAVVVDQSSTMNMYGGEIEAIIDFNGFGYWNDVVGILIQGQNAVQKDSTVNVSGGKISVGGKNAFAQGIQVGEKNYSSTNCTVNISGGEISINATENGQGYAFTAVQKPYAEIEMTGGVISGNVTSLTLTQDNDNAALTIKGGTVSATGVNEEDVKAYVAEGYTYDTETSTVKPDTTEPTGVARIGNAYYETLEAAIKATKTGDTVTLLQNVDLGTSSIKFYNSGVENLTFDLGGHKITSAVENNGTVIASRTGLVIKNGTIENTSTGTKKATSAIYVTGGGTTTLENVTLVSNKSGLYVCQLSNAVSVTVDIGGQTATNAVYGVLIDAPTGTPSKIPSVTLNISGGTINGTSDGVKVNSPGGGKTGTVKTNITGGTVSSVNIVSNSSTYPATLEISGGTVEGALICNSYSEITVKDGIFNGKVEMLGTNGTITISGGTFSSAVKEEYCADGYVPKDNGDGTYGVTKATAYVAKIADKGQYETLEAAFAAAKDGDTITLLSNCSGNGIVVKKGTFTGKGLIVDFGNYTYSVGGVLVGSATTGTNAFQLNENNNITFQNGTIAGVDENTRPADGTDWEGAPAIVIQNYCNLTLTKMTVRGGTKTCYTLSNNNGTTQIVDSTIIAGENTKMGGPWAFDACGFSSYAGPTVTVKNSTIKGDIEISYDTKHEHNVTLALETGTTINGALVAGDNAEKVTVTKSSGVDLNAPAGYLWVAGDDSTSTLAKAVAQIGDKQYASLQAAFDEAKTGETVTLLDDITLTEQVNITKALDGLTLDGNGKTITCATTTDPLQSGGSALYFGNAGNNLYCTGIKIKDLTMTGTARFAIFLCGGRTTEFTNVNISGDYYYAINLYGTHGATMTNCNISNSKDLGSNNQNGASIWSNVASDFPLTLNNSNVGIIGINKYTTDNKLEPKIFVMDGSLAEIHTLDDGTVSGNKKLCVSPTSTGTYTIKEYDETNSEWIDIKVYVAEYNGTKYESLQEAIDAASQRNGGQAVVTLLGNVTITKTISFVNVSAASVLLDLGGYTLTGKNCRAIQVNKGNLYLENGTVTSTGIIDSSSVIRIGSNEDAYSGISPMLYMRNSAKVLAPESYGVTIFGSKTVSEKLTVAGNASIEATGPSPAISGNGDKAFHVDGKGTQITITGNAVVSATNNYAIYHPDNGTLNIQDNATISGKGGIQMCSGTLKIIGSPKIETLGKADHETGEAGPIYDIAAISAANRSYPGGAPVVTIKDTPTITTVDGENGEVIHAFSWDNTTKTESEWAEAGDCINVSGGTYNKTFNEAYLAEGCTLAAKDGMYTVEQTPVAEYNGTQYTSLAQAFTDARNSEAKATVKLLADVKVTTSLDISSPQGVTLDLDKKTLTLAGGAQLYTSKTATIKKGTIKRIDEPTSGNARDFAIQVMSGSTLLLGGTQAIQKVVLESQYGIYNVGGLLNVRYANITTDGWSIAVNDSASKTGSVVIGSIGTANITSQNGNCIGTAVNSKPNVTISKGTLTSNGTAWDAGVIYWASEGTLTITGGTFKASSAEGSTAAAVYQKNGTVKISGITATLLGNNALVVQAGEGSTGTMVTELSGGKYSTEPDEAWVVEGKEVHIKDGLFVVEGEYVVEATLADGTIKSFDSWDKLTAVWNQTGATIKLLKDTSTAELVAPNGKLTIDFNGKTLTVTKASSSNAKLEAAIVVQSGGELTLKDSVGNGGLTTTNVYGVEVITGSKLTIESGNYKCFTSAVQVDNGTAYIKGGTFQTEDTDKRYLLNCIDEAFKDGTAVMEVTGGTFYGFDPSAKPEGEGTTYVKVGYVVKGNDSVYTVKKSDKDAAMFDADGKLLGYEDVANAVNDPKAVTIKLIKNATVNGLVLLGKTLDLNGFTLTTLYVAAFDKGNLIDSKEGEGLLKFTGTSSLSLCKDNSYLPLYDKSEQGYRFFSYQFKARGIAGSSADSRQFWFSIVFGSDKAYTLLKNAGHGLEIRLSLQVGTNDAMEAVVPQQAIASWVNAIKVNGGTYEADNAGFYMAVKGLSKIGDDTVTVTGIAKIKGVEVKSDGALTYPKTN